MNYRIFFIRINSDQVKINITFSIDLIFGGDDYFMRIILRIIMKKVKNNIS